MRDSLDSGMLGSVGTCGSTRARDFVERHRIAFARNQIEIRRSEDYPAEKYHQSIEETLRRLALPS